MRVNRESFKLAMARNQFNVTELSCASGVSKNTIYYWLAEHDSEPTPKAIGKVATALGVDVTELIEK